MIAKAATISHGSNAIRYSVNKDRSDIVKTNLLPDDISPEAMFKRMMFVQKMFANERKRGRPLTDNVIRIEISPTAEESKGWTMDDWARLADEFIQEFDSIDLSKRRNALLPSRPTSKVRNTLSPYIGMQRVAFSTCTLMPTVWIWRAKSMTDTYPA